MRKTQAINIVDRIGREEIDDEEMELRRGDRASFRDTIFYGDHSAQTL